MDESEKNDIETHLSKIDGRLVNIEKQIVKSQKSSWQLFGYSFGLAAMVAGMAISNVQNSIMGIIIFSVGFIVSAVALVFIYGGKFGKNRG